MFRFAFLTACAFVLPFQAHAEADWPRTIAQPDGDLTLAAPPARVVSTTPSLTGILLAIDAPVVSTATAVVGPLTDEQGFFLQWADIARERGVEVLYPNLAFDIEALIVSDPDLVVASATGGDAILPFVPELRAQGMPVMVLDYFSANWQTLARQLGRATGHEADAERIIADFDARTAAARDDMTIPAGKVSIVSYNFSGTYSVSRPTSPQAGVLAALGFTVTGLPEAMRGDVTRSQDFDFISRENLAAAIAGDGVFLLNGTEESVKAFMDDPVLANLPAVRNGHVWPLGPTSFRVDYYSGLQMVETVAPYFPK
ncbi:Fe2+-enterobactin ABC transporter substrate-binding protein [Paenirhodobacter populi]|uniref:Fe2+-enterobactin ABC transporter substrate-binding protein n=1 Tax=Paenirhodobacter populi TaxID=2306993 RepID=UPI000FE34208|nr:Fe2+-enterobactin ABC transporter substrate-binding protein [Sinirhodobacter populi]RWR05725.1 Fe2+-enterobactin ABC transporter substrate-binding protein [Sinirhodobacter populi]